MTPWADRSRAPADMYRVTVVGGALRHEVRGSTDRAAWLSRHELAELSVVSLLEEAMAIALDDGVAPG